MKLYDRYNGELDFKKASFNDIKEWLRRISNAINYQAKDIVS
nr:MAG TPA: hypothetical protein [Bacteriophage sp.]